LTILIDSVTILVMKNETDKTAAAAEINRRAEELAVQYNWPPWKALLTARAEARETRALAEAMRLRGKSQ